ncbi:hypothetical protein T484DRAFT_2096184 [Baffinella frigidus]|nr:hypothetical protein T484DRAFT_2096184 [Cryptophyta sp. CCMP2293]
MPLRHAAALLLLPSAAAFLSLAPPTSHPSSRMSPAWIAPAVLLRTRVPLLRPEAGPFALEAGPLRRGVAIRMGAPEGMDEEEYARLTARAQEMKGTFDALMSSSLPPDSGGQQTAPAIPENMEGAQMQARAKLENQKNEEIDALYENDMLDPELFTPSITEASGEGSMEFSGMDDDVKMNVDLQREGDKAFEASEVAIKAGDFKAAKARHIIAYDKYEASGLLQEESIFRDSFLDSLDDQRRRIEIIKSV